MKVLSINYSEETKGYRSHYHDAHELLYVAEGRIAVSIGGKEYGAGAGSLFVFSRFEEHSVRVLTTEYRRYTLLISPAIASTDDYLLASVLINRTGGFYHMIDLGEERGGIESLFQNMTDEFNSKAPMYEKLLEAKLTELLVCIYRSHPKLFLADENGNTDIVRRLQSRFEQSYGEQFSLCRLAAEYHVSPSYLSHVFKKVTGYAPIEYLTSCRISAAKNLLSSTDRSIKEIIDLCGFSDESNFSRTFKNKVGVTPTKFRKMT